jgi:hypothetical protein
MGLVAASYVGLAADMHTCMLRASRRSSLLAAQRLSRAAIRAPEPAPHAPAHEGAHTGTLPCAVLREGPIRGQVSGMHHRGPIACGWLDGCMNDLGRNGQRESVNKRWHPLGVGSTTQSWRQSASRLDEAKVGIKRGVAQRGNPRQGGIWPGVAYR